MSDLPISERYKETGKCKACYIGGCQRWRDRNQDKCRKYSRDWGRSHPENSHKHKLKNRYGMTTEEYNQKLNSQGGVCAICHRPEIKNDRRSGRTHFLSVDHDHKTRVNRGLLCDSCNKAIGLFGEDISILETALRYLQSYQFREPKKNG